MSYESRSKIFGLVSKENNDILRDVRRVGGNCEGCEYGVYDTAKELRCRVKQLKVVKRYNMCSLFKEQNE